MFAFVQNCPSWLGLAVAIAFVCVLIILVRFALQAVFDFVRACVRVFVRARASDDA